MKSDQEVITLKAVFVDGDHAFSLKHNALVNARKLECGDIIELEAPDSHEQRPYTIVKLDGFSYKNDPLTQKRRLMITYTVEDQNSGHKKRSPTVIKTGGLLTFFRAFLAGFRFRF